MSDETHIFVDRDKGFESIVCRTEDDEGNVRLQGIVRGMVMDFFEGSDVYVQPKDSPRITDDQR